MEIKNCTGFFFLSGKVVKQSTLKVILLIFMGERQVEELKGPPRPFRIGKHLKDLREKNSPEGIWELLLRLFTSLRVCVLRKKRQRAKCSLVGVQIAK